MKAVRMLLLDMGITPDMKGFDCICTAVKLITTDKDKCRSMMKYLYPKVAEIEVSSVSKVERNIRHAIAKAVSLDHGEMKNLIGISPYKNKTTNSEFLFSLAYAVSKNKEEK